MSIPSGWRHFRMEPEVVSDHTNSPNFYLACLSRKYYMYFLVSSRSCRYNHSLYVLLQTLLPAVPPPTSNQTAHPKQDVIPIRTPAMLTSRGSAPGLGRPPVQHTLSGPAGSQQYLQNQHFSLSAVANPLINNR